MSNEGKQILESTRNFRTYLKNICQLLSTAGAILEKHGYKIFGDKACAVVESTSIVNPNYWVPQDAFMFLTHRENKHIMLIVSVIMDDLDNPNSIDQPFVSAVWFNSGKKVGGNWSYKLSRIILSLQQFSMEGKLIDISPEIFKNFSNSLDILSSKALAVPLVDIQTEHDISVKIVKPLVESIPLT